MNIFLGRSIVRRVFVFFLLYAVVVLGGIFFWYGQSFEAVPFPVLAGALAVFGVYFLGVFYHQIARPLTRILEQMKALLTGKKYRRIYTTRMDEIGVISHFFNEVTKSFEKVSMDIREEKRMMSELEIAAALQRDILPLKSPKIPGLDIVAKNRPAEELGGDSFDFVTVGDNSYIYIGDVTGHGVPAALVMTMVNTLIHTFVEIFDSAYEVVVNTNKQLKTRMKSTMFMTMLLLRWNAKEQKMFYVGSGHEHLVIYRKATGKCEVQKSGGIALGMVPDNHLLVKEEQVGLDVGDVVVLYSDGLTEGRNMGGQQYTLPRLTAAIERYAVEYGPDGIVQHIALDFSHFVQDQKQEDDVTLIALQYVGVGKEKLKDGADASTQWTAEAAAPKK